MKLLIPVSSKPVNILCKRFFSPIRRKTKVSGIRPVRPQVRSSRVRWNEPLASRLRGFSHLTDWIFLASIRPASLKAPKRQSNSIFTRRRRSWNLFHRIRVQNSLVKSQNSLLFLLLFWITLRLHSNSDPNCCVSKNYSDSWLFVAWQRRCRDSWNDLNCPKLIPRAASLCSTTLHGSVALPRWTIQ